MDLHDIGTHRIPADLPIYHLRNEYEDTASGFNYTYIAFLSWKQEAKKEHKKGMRFFGTSLKPASLKKD